MTPRHVAAALLAAFSFPLLACASAGGVDGARLAPPVAEPPATPRGVAARAPADCAPQSAHFSIASCCGGDATFRWNGHACITSPCGCLCEGPDCGRFYASEASCRDAHAGCP